MKNLKDLKKAVKKSLRSKLAFVLGAAAFLTPFPRRAQAATVPNLESGTEYSQHIKALNDRFRAEAPDTHMILMDRDWFQLNAAKAQLAPDDDAGRQKLMAEYIHSRLGLTVKPERFTGGIVFALNGFDWFTWPAQPGNLMNQEQPYVCLSFGQAADDSLEAQARREMGLDPDIVGASVAGMRLHRYLSLSTENGWSDYHEAAHCLDPRLKKDNSALSPADRALIAHQSEMFADVMAALLLAQDGVTDFAPTAADIRLVAAALRGPLAASKPNTTDEHYIVFAYTVHDGLRAAQEEIERRGTANLKKMSLDEIRALTEDIVAKNALDAKKAEAIILMQKNFYDLTAVDNLRRKDKSYEDAYQYVLRLKADMDRSMRSLIDLKGFDTGPAEQQVQFGFGRTPFSFNPAAARENEIVTKLLAERMVKMAGKNPTPESIAPVFNRYKDYLRKKLETGNPEDKKTASKYLGLMDEATMEAMRRVSPPKKAPAP